MPRFIKNPALRLFFFVAFGFFSAGYAARVSSALTLTSYLNSRDFRKENPPQKAKAGLKTDEVAEQGLDILIDNDDKLPKSSKDWPGVTREAEPQHKDYSIKSTPQIVRVPKVPTHIFQSALIL